MNHYAKTGFPRPKTGGSAPAGIRGGRIIDGLPRPSLQIWDNFLAPGPGSIAAGEMTARWPGLLSPQTRNPEVCAW